MRQSMTGFASQSGRDTAHSWQWELRGVNNRGLDLRLRLPDGIEGLDPLVRKALAARLSRGSVQVSLRLGAETDVAVPQADPDALDAVVGALAQAEKAAARAGITLAPSTAADILALRGVLTTATPAADTDALRAAVLADFDTALEAFVAARAEEGARLADVVADQVATIENLVADATDASAARAPQQAARLNAQLARVLENTDGVDPDRLTQELALLAVRADVTEEIDRLTGHVAAARALLAEDAPVGRRLDFLCQEFNREANTLCSKSGDAALTKAGLALKPVIEHVISYGMGHFYISQSDKGGLVFGGDLDMYPSYAARGNLPLKEHVMEAGMTLMPMIGKARVLRSWGGIMDMSPDGSPIIDRTHVDGLFLNCGWCYGGFKAVPASGHAYAHLIATGQPHVAATGFRLDRFNTGYGLMDEEGTGAQHNLH